MDISTVIDAAMEVDNATDEAYETVARIAADRFGIDWRTGPEDAGDECADALRAFFQVCARLALARIESEDDAEA